MAKEIKKIIHYLSGKEIDVTNKPEEIIRQEYIKRLVEEYGYPKEAIADEVPIYYGSGKSEVKDIESGKPKRADIVVYRDKKDKESNERPYIIVECKKKDESTGERQVQSYGNVTRCPIIVWHNGLDTRYWKIQKEPNDWEIVGYLPKFGKYYGDKKILKKDLRPATNLQSTFKRIHNDIYANMKSGNKAKVFYQVVYLLFAKIQDEKENNTECEFVIYDREFKEIQDKGDSKSFRERVFGLFERVKTRPEYRNVFDGDEKIEIPLLQIAYLVSELEFVTVLKTDVKGEAFQAFLSNHFRGDAGQFFTPDPLKSFMVDMIDPQLDEVVLDPACGSSGFLVFTIKHYKNILKKRRGWIDKNGNPKDDTDLTQEEREILKLELKNIANVNLKGVDFDNDLTKVAKMYMVMIDDGHSGIHTCDSLLPFKDIEKLTDKDIRKGCANIILTNPPFGTKGKVKKREILVNFDFGHKWSQDINGNFIKGDLLESNEKSGGQVPDILFIERCIDFLKPNGRMAIVLPDGDLNNRNTSFVRSWLEKKVQIVGVVSVPSTAFDPYGAKGIKTSVLIIKKPKEALPDNYPIFFSNLECIGYDTSGKIIYVTNDDGEILDTKGNVIEYKMNKKGEKIKQDEEKVLLYGAIKNDILQMLEDWKNFSKKNKSFLW